MTRLPVVTDHAVLRYLERVNGIDIAFIRHEIAAATEQALAMGARNLTRNGVVYQFREGVVVTVIAANSAIAARLSSHHNRGKDSRLKNGGRRHRREQRFYAGEDDE